MTDRDWKNLLLTVRAGSCVLFVGPGLSDTRGRGGVTLQEHLATALSDASRRPAGTTLPVLAEQFERERGLGRSALVDEVREFYRRRDQAPGPLETALAALPFPLILTTLFDRRLELALSQHAEKRIRAERYHFKDIGREGRSLLQPWTAAEPLVYYLQGWLDEDASLVLTEHDLIEFLKAVVTDHPPLPKTLLAHVRREDTTFLFLGFGLRHPYLRFFLSHFRALGLRKNDSYALEPAPPASSESDDAVLFYDSERIGFRQAPIVDFVRELYRQFEAAGPATRAVQTTKARVRPRVFISYASEDAGAARRLFDDLEREEFDVWLDKVRLEGGDEWDPTIETEIERSDFILILQSQALARKTDSYVNKEIALAKDRALKVRPRIGSEKLRCLIPLQIEEAPLVDDLKKYQTMPLGLFDYGIELADLVKLMRRDDQLRRRQELR
jgi:hypothetical protein